MSNHQYRRVVGDTESDITDQLLGDNTPIDITNVQTVAFHLEKPDNTTLTATNSNSAVTVTNASEGRVEYSFQSGDLDQAGRYRYEWQVTFADGGILTFPGDSLAKIWVRAELD